MIVRIESEETPEGRIAAAARCLIIRMDPDSLAPDTADLREHLAPYVLRELLRSQIDIAKKSAAFYTDGKIFQRLRDVEALIEMREKGSA